MVDALIWHPDVRRMLLTQKAIAEGGRAMIYGASKIADKMFNAVTEGDKAAYKKIDDELGFYTPILKGFLTEMGLEAANLGIQVFGGHGYIGEHGMELPPPRTHRHRYFGVLAPNSPLRAAVTALAQPPTRQTEPANMSEGAPGVVPLGHAIPPTPESATPKRSKAHYLWAVLIARVYEVFPLLCPRCVGQMRLIAFTTEGTQIRKILDHIGVDPDPPRISPARGPPLWDDCDAQMDDGAQIEQADWDLALQPAPDYEVDQRINW